MVGKIKIDGSSTVFPLTEAIAEEFNKEHPRFRISIGLSGTAGGFRKMTQNEIDICNASRPIDTSEKRNLADQKIEYLELITAFDGLAILAHPENNWLDYITIAELKKIWEPEAQGKVTRWNQIRPEWPNQEIHLFGAGLESGTYDFFTNIVVGKSHASRGDYTASEDDNVLVRGISTDKLSLGFFGYAYYDENKSFLKLIPVVNDSLQTPVYPSLETVMNKNYPLGRPLYIYLNQNSLQKPGFNSFIKFHLEQSILLADEVGCIPLNEQELRRQMELFSQFSAKYSR